VRAASPGRAPRSGDEMNSVALANSRKFTKQARTSHLGTTQIPTVRPRNSPPRPARRRSGERGRRWIYLLSSTCGTTSLTHRDTESAVKRSRLARLRMQQLISVATIAVPDAEAGGAITLFRQRWPGQRSDAGGRPCLPPRAPAQIPGTPLGPDRRRRAPEHRQQDCQINPGQTRPRPGTL